MTEPRAVGRLSADRQKLLRLLLAEKGVRAPARDAIPRRAPAGPPPALSFAQQRLWLLDRLEPGSAFYNIPFVIRLAGRLDLSALLAALIEVVRRHEALRTTFGEAEGRPFQVIAPEPAPELGITDLSGLPEGVRTAEVVRLTDQEAARPFDLECGPLIRAAVLRLATNEHVALVTMHHIVSDGWSCGVLLRETASLYDAAARGFPPPLPPLPIQYADFAEWQRTWLSGAVLEEQLGWWRDQLAGAPEALDLPTDHPRPAASTHRGSRRPMVLPPALADRLRDLCRREDATLFMALLAAFATVLGRAAGQTDVVIGTPIANRNREEIEGLIGFFVNTLALRVDLAGEPGFRALLARVRQTAHGAYAHQDLPFERVVEELAPERVTGRNPLFQVMCALQNTPADALEVPGLTLALLSTETGTAKFDLSLFLSEIDGLIQGHLEFSTELFDPPTADRWIAHLERLLEAALDDPEAPVAELPLLSNAERHQLVIEWNDTEPAPEGETTAGGVLLHELFEAQVERTPDAIALIVGEERWTYRELDEKAEAVAAELRGRGLGMEDRVAVSLPRTGEMVAALLGILKAGGAYVPVDPGYPEGRREMILADAAPWTLTPRPPLPPPQPPSLGEGETGGDVSFPLSRGGRKGERERGPGGEGPSGGRLAYLIYTSGSTGDPKGVAITHTSAVALVRWALGVFSADELSRVLAATSINFDLSVFEIFVPLSVGGAVVLAEDALALPRLPAAGEVTLINTVPSAMTELVRAGAVPPSVRTVNLAGEPVPRELVDALYRIPTVRRVVDVYGPTEDTVYSTFACMEREDPRAPSIGRPVTGTWVRLLDRAGQTVPIGIPGELCLGGAGLARGYLGRPGLTAERWVPDPVPPVPGARIYRTGDLARYRTDGSLEFLGRIDHQVKVRGFRIELGEIEETLRGLPGVRETAVLALGEGAERRLAAFVAGDGLAVADLREALRNRLPVHMVPTTFTLLEALPLTPNGKVDRRKLIAHKGTDEARASESFVAPRGPVEELVAEIFAEVLDTERIGATDHFFELGGHSLLAMRALSRVRSTLGADLPLRAVFEAPTVEALARRIEEARQSSGATADDRETPPLRPVPRDRDLPLSFAQERMWFMDRLAPGLSIYNVPEVTRLHGPLRPEVLARALDEMVARHETLRTRFGLSRDGRPIQVIDPEVHLPFPIVDLSNIPEPLRTRETERVAWTEVRRPFDLTQGPVLRAGLIRLGPEDHVTLLARHHIISDGWSMDLFAWEISVLYQAFAEGKPSPLPPPPIQYADFAVWQRELLQGELLERQLAYWRQRLAGAPPLLELPTDRPRPPLQTHRGEIRTLYLSEELVRDLRGLARRDGATLFMLLLTAFETWMHRVTGRDDLVVGTPVANRHRPELETLLGFLANTLVLRTDLSGDPLFREALARVRDAALGAYENQDVPFERVVEELRPKRDLSYTPIFQVMYVQQAVPRDLPAGMGRLENSQVGGDQALARFDFELYAMESPSGMALAAEYNVDLFDRVRIDRTLGHLKTLLNAVLANPEQRLSELPLLTEPERHQLLVEWAGGPELEGEEALLHELFEAQAARTPEAVALVSGEERWTYRALKERAEVIAADLRGRISFEDRVAVSLPRTPEMVAAMLGILKAGGVYVPVDPGYPAGRREAILADAAPWALTPRPPLPPPQPPSLGEGETALGLDEREAGDVSFPLSRGGRKGERERGPGGEGHSGGRLAYLIYTSGSTGEPKGVAIPHTAAVALVRWAGTVFSQDDLRGVLASTSINFDLSVFEIFVPLAYGGMVILAENALELPRLPASDAVTLVNTVPSAMAELVRSGGVPASVRVVNLAGEPLTRALADRILALPQVERLYDLYGPSEDTTYSTFAQVPRGEARSPAIGRPIAGSRAVVVDRWLRPAPVGVPGELCLAGAGLARGYLGRPAATAEKWVPDPFSGMFGGAGERMYRTGDLVRWRAEGELEFLGRIDHQVKVRGFRIEPGEIEAALRAYPGIEEAVVAARGQQLVAWVAGADPGALTPAELRRFLRERLPEPLIPSFFVALADLPRTATGKVDRAALPEPGAAREEKAAWEPPRGPLEQLVADLWGEVLGLEGIGIHDDFFDLGGHSLLATQYVSRLRDSLGIDLPVRAVFEAPTVAGQARRALSGRLSQEGAILAREPGQEAPLSFAQERMWFLDQLAPEGAYHIPAAVRFRGALQPKALEGSLREIVRRQEALRTVFPEAGGRPVQRVVAGLPELARIDLSALPEKMREAELRRLAEALAAAPFDLARGPVVRFALVRLGPEEHALAVTMHHIASDGWSIGVFVRELAALYPALAAGLPSPLPELPIQYADWARWQRERLGGAALAEEVGWWRESLGGDLPVLELPADRPRPPAPSFRGGELGAPLPEDLAVRLRALGRSRRASLFMTLLSAFQLLLHRLSSQETVVVGTPVAGRDRTEVEGLIGLFVNTLALRSDRADEGFAAWLARTRDRVLDAWAHQEVPFERLVEELQPRRSLAHAPLFQTLLALQNMPVPPLDLPGVRLEPLDVETGRAPFDLTVAFVEGEEAIHGSWVWARDLFDEPTVVRFAGWFRNLLEAATADPERSVLDLPLLSNAEREALLREAEGAPQSPSPLRLDELFTEQARRTPEAVAIAAGGQEISYAELDDRSSRLAARLAALGGGPEVVVGLLAERSPELIVGMLAILKAGGAYLPLDPSHPAERLAFMLRDAGAGVVLKDHSGLDVAFPVTVRVEALTPRPPLPPHRPPSLGEGETGLGAEEQESSVSFPLSRGGGVVGRERGSGGEGSAYVTYTSGSTGQPKGVVVPHRAVTRLVLATDYVPLGPSDRIAQVSNTSFDAATFEIWGALLNGARLVLLPREVTLEPRALAEALRREGITALFLTTALFQQIAREEPAAFATVRSVLFGGEAVDPRGPRAVLEARGPERLLHVYGPTECTTFSTWHPVADVPGEARTVPIGRPIAGARALVLDPRGEPVPPGVAGELFLGGEGLARGYLGRPGLTAERFVPDPFGPPGSRLYRTGDRVRWADGAIEFLGRFDNQVKIRGFRVEPGEIEAALAAHPGVVQATVLVQEEEGDRRLVAYVSGAPSAAELRTFLRERLPEPMIPAGIVLLPELPLTPNGKVDRAALARLDIGCAERTSDDTPRTPTEELLSTLWADLLGVERPGPSDRFFDLGGHSLLAAHLVAWVREVFGVELSVRAVFEEPTLGTLAAHIEALQRAGTLAAPPIRRAAGPPPLSFAQQRLWFLDRLAPGRAAYNIPAALRIRGDLDAEALEQALRQIQQRHEALRTTFTETEGEPVAVVAPEPLGRLERLDLQSEAVDAWLAAEAARPFDLQRGPLLRTTLLRVGEGEHVLSLTLHHIVADGWSVGVLVRELTELYTAVRERRTAALPELPVQYGDFARWQRDLLSGDVLATEVARWRERLAGAPEVLDLPVDRPWPAVPSGRGGALLFVLPAPLSASLNALARREAVTPFMLLLTGFAALLARWCGQDDLLIGAPVAGRDRRETENLIGLLVNTLVLRVDLRGEPALQEALRRVRETALDAFVHPDLPFEKLVEELQPERSLARPPLVQVTFALQNLPPMDLSLPDLTLEALALDSGVVKAELGLALVEQGEVFAATLSYAADLFEQGTVERLVAGFQTLLGEIAAADPSRPLLDLEILPEAERRQLLEWSSTEEHPSDLLLHELFERQAERTPEAVAVIFEEERWTYADLLRRSREIAAQLREQGIGPGDRVAILEGRSAERVARVLGVWAAGAASVAVDPEQPEVRRAETLSDAGAVGPHPPGPPLPSHTHPPGEGGTPTRLTERGLGGGAPLPGGGCAMEEGTGVRFPAYVVYTSGSTGRPKGILAHHQGAATYLEWVIRNYGLSESDVSLQLAPLTFDAALRDTLAPLAAGGRIVIVPDDVARDPAALLERMAAQGVTCLPSIVPSLLRPLAEEAQAAGWKLPSLRLILASGETLLGADAMAVRRGFGEGVRLVNQYGPSEATMTSTWYSVTPADETLAALPVGRPAASARVFLLDRALRPVPGGAVGEVCLGGPGLAHGYLGQPDRTAEAFVPDPFGAPGERLYRTGDRGRFRSDGVLELLGRLDLQVKIRGQRVEPGEVEAVLRKHPAVRDAAVAARGAEPRLTAWVVAEGAGADNLRTFLAERLPTALIPVDWAFLDALPLTPHGKVDRARLPEPGRERAAAQEPRDRTELQLVHLWEEVLGVHPIGVTDNFFALGGHSLAAVRLMAGVRRLFGRNLPLAELFRRPTIESLAHLLGSFPPLPEGREGVGEGGQGGEGPLVCLSEGDPNEAPLFCIHGAGGNILVFADLARLLGERPVYAFEARGLSDDQPPLDRIEDMADLYLAALRATRPHGPYRLLGYSMGSKIAFEIARRLEQEGETVERLTLVDIPAVVPEGTEEPLDPEVPDLPGLDPEAVRRHLAVWRANREASRHWVPGTYGGEVLLIVAEEGIGAGAADPTLGWGAVARGGVQVVTTPGDHSSLLRPPHVQMLVERLRG